MVRFGFRVPSLKKRLSARTSVKRYVRNSLGLKSTKGLGLDHEPQESCLQPRLQQDDQRLLGAGDRYGWRSGCCGCGGGYELLNPR